MGLTSVYGPQGGDDKVAFLDELREVRVACHGPRAVVGDFNTIYMASDKNNLNLNRRNMGRFRRFIDDHELKDLHLHGRMFTWSNERDRPTPERLDRVIVSVDWEESFRTATFRRCRRPFRITVRPSPFTHGKLSFPCKTMIPV